MKRLFSRTLLLRVPVFCASTSLGFAATAPTGTPGQPAGPNAYPYALGSDVVFTWDAVPTYADGDPYYEVNYTINGTPGTQVVTEASALISAATGDSIQVAVQAVSPLDTDLAGPSSPLSAAIKLLDAAADEDNDGQTNGDEDEAGTNPLDPDSYFRISDLAFPSPGSRMLSWASVPGKIYRVEASTDLGDWSGDKLRQSRDIEGDSGPRTSWTDSEATNTVFYRVAVVPPRRDYLLETRLGIEYLVAAGSTAQSDATGSVWVVEPAGSGWVRIREAQSGLYLKGNGLDAAVHLEAWNPDYLRMYWKMEDHAGYKRFQCRQAGADTEPLYLKGVGNGLDCITATWVESHKRFFWMVHQGEPIDAPQPPLPAEPAPDPDFHEQFSPANAYLNFDNQNIQVDTTGAGSRQEYVWTPVDRRLTTTDNYRIEFDYTITQGDAYSLFLKFTNDDFAEDVDQASWVLIAGTVRFTEFSSVDGSTWARNSHASIAPQLNNTYHISITQRGGEARIYIYDKDKPEVFAEMPTAPMAVNASGELRLLLTPNTKLTLENMRFVEAADDTPDYYYYVKAYADALVAWGRDIYGPEPSPLFADALDRHIFKTNEGFDGISGIRSSDRIVDGANPMHDQNLYQILYALSELSGDPSYAEAADEALTWFFEHCQSPVTGLMAWGEHIGWGFLTEYVTGTNFTHEFYRPWVRWDKTYELAPAAAEAFAMGVWDHQIQNQNTGAFSRHAKWHKHGPETQNEFPRHGGFYMRTWAEAYERTGDTTYLTAIETLVDMYNNISDPDTGCIPSSTARPFVSWPTSFLSQNIDLHEALQVIPSPLREKIQARIDISDTVYLSLTHSFNGPDEGFAKGADPATLEVFTEGEWTNSTPYAVGYGEQSNGAVAAHCYMRYLQLPDGPTREDYRDLIIASAEQYLVTEPVLNYPASIASVIWHLLDAYELTGDARYFARAKELANIAVWEFLPQDSPLPKASASNDHYEAITQADSLMMSLLRLWNMEQETPAALSLEFSDR